MGYGDEIMATAFAKIEKQKYPERQVVVGNIDTRQATYSKIFYNNPNISDPRKLDESKIVHFVNLSNINRLYIDWQKSTKHKYFWNLKHRPLPGELFFDVKEINEAKTVINRAKESWQKSNVKKTPLTIRNLNPRI